MKKLAIIILVALTLTSCVKNEEKNIENNNNVENETTFVSTGAVKNTDTISVSYTGSTTDGEVFDASSMHPGEVLSFTVGEGKMIPGFEKGVLGMKLGETKTLNIEAKDAYGETNELLLGDEDFTALESIGIKKEDLTVGVHKIEQTGGEIEILRVEDGNIYAKHPSPLAGKDLVFEITIDEIVPFVKKEVVSAGDNIAVTYTGSLEDGSIFDASSKHGGKPLEFTAGAGQMIAGFDAGVIGMKLGETKTLKIDAKDAYGEETGTGAHELAGKNLIFEVRIESIK